MLIVLIVFESIEKVPEISEIDGIWPMQPKSKKVPQSQKNDKIFNFPKNSSNRLKTMFIVVFVLELLILMVKMS